ncbi:hypothetical protein C8J57DRAFT_1252460 [Mycena rebaudengoi]|nr:hypothetical protein C8J57DRAFT_1252460 [Mycena rebaudengoi]
MSTDPAILHLQLTSTEILVYSRTAKRLVIISWPTHNGYMIRAHRLKDWLRARGLFLECFCGFTSDYNHPRSCQIVVSSVTKDVFAFCHFDQPKCGFKINFSKIESKVLLKSSFGHLPTLHSGDIPDMTTLLATFTLRKYPSNDMAPHFEGYFGEHISMYPPGTQQLSGPIIPRAPSRRGTKRRHSSPYVRYQKSIPSSNARYLEIDEIDDFYPRQPPLTAPARFAPVAGPSRIPMESISQASSSRIRPEGEERCLRKLLAGDGVSETAWMACFPLPTHHVRA